MAFDSFDAWLHMGGYGLYVWGSIGVSLLLPAIEVLALRMRRKAALRAVAASREDQQWERDENAA